MLVELREELGLLPEHIRSLTTGSILRLPEGDGMWIVHTFDVGTPEREFQLNWENDGVVWSSPGDVPAQCVTWLADVLESIRPEVT